MNTCKHKGCDNLATYGKQCQPCRNYLQRYGLTKPQVLDMLDSQSGLCFLCNRPVELGKYKGVVDHSHTTGEVRAILCHDCNTVVGFLENNMVDLDKLKSYLS